MDVKNKWGNVSFKGVVLVALVSLIVGLGISGALDWLAPSRAVNLLGEGGNSDVRTSGQLPDFVSLAKKMRPVVVNISTTQLSDTRGGGSQEFGSPFGEYPAMGAVVAHETGFTGKLPPYVAVPRNPSFTWELGKSAFLGGRYESFKAGDPTINRIYTRPTDGTFSWVAASPGTLPIRIPETCRGMLRKPAAPTPERAR